jgi:hypothetical protein
VLVLDKIESPIEDILVTDTVLDNVNTSVVDVLVPKSIEDMVGTVLEISALATEIAFTIGGSTQEESGVLYPVKEFAKT